MIIHLVKGKFFFVRMVNREMNNGISAAMMAARPLWMY
jgi:hypothetical protein